MAVTAGRGHAHDPVAAENGVVAPRVGIVGLAHQADQLSGHAGSLLLLYPGLADEFLVHLHRPGHVGLQRGVVDIHFALPGQVAFFETHGIHGIHAEHLQIKRFTGGHQGLKNRNLGLDGVEDLIAQFPHVVHAVDPALDPAHIDFTAGAEREGLVGDIVVAGLGQDLTALGAGDYQAAEFIGHIFHTDAAVGGQVLHQPVLVVPLAHRGGDTEVLAFLDPGNGHVRLEVAVVVQHGGQGNAAIFDRHLLAGQVVEPGLGAGAGDAGLGKTGKVQDARVFHDVLAFGIHVF